MPNKRVSEKTELAVLTLIIPLIEDTHKPIERVGFYKKLRAAYTGQRDSANRRGISWEFDFLAWVELWVRSGHLLDRGLKGDGFVMARYKDAGPYAPTNVEVIKASANVSQPQVRAKTARTIAKRKARGVPTKTSVFLQRGVHHRSKPVADSDGRVYPSVRAASEVSTDHIRSTTFISAQCTIWDLYGAPASAMEKMEHRWRYLTEDERAKHFPRPVKAVVKSKRKNFGRRVTAPDGTCYENTVAAAVAHGITRARVSQVCRSGHRGWSYVNGDEN